MHESRAHEADQAAGLRRLFGAARARLAPILVDPDHAAAQAAAIVRFAQACAHAGQRTLVLDCVRAQIAASLGLRARFDLLQAARGECRIDQARLDAGANLCVLPAARAAAQCAKSSHQFLALLATLWRAEAAPDVVLMIMEPAHASLLPPAGTSACEVIVPVLRQRAAWTSLLPALARVADRTDIAGFRLLFPAWDAGTAARLYEELVRACGNRLGTELRFGGAVRVAHDWLRVVRTMGDWDLSHLPRPQTVRTF